jgi:hypothetical protein
MPYLANLAAIARGAGLRVVEQPGWQSRGHGPQTGVKTIVCHHTGTTNATANAPSLGIVQNGRAYLAGPLSHFVLGRDGTVFVVAAGQCWHTGATWQTAQSNAYAIGIEAEGTGYAAWPEVQLDAYARLCRALCTAFGLGVDRVQGHKEICSPAGRKPDPNFDMGAFRSRVANLSTNSGEDDEMAGHFIDHEYPPASGKQFHHRAIQTSVDSAVVIGGTWFELSAGYADLVDVNVYFNKFQAPIHLDRIAKDQPYQWRVPEGCDSISFDYECAGPSSSLMIYGTKQ